MAKIPDKSIDYVSIQKRAICTIDGKNPDGNWLVRLFKWVFRIKRPWHI